MAERIWKGFIDGTLSNARNYVGGTAPGDGDSLVIADSSRDIADGEVLAPSTALTSIKVYPTYTGIARLLTVKADAVFYNGRSPYFKLDVGNTLTDINVEDTGVFDDVPLRLLSDNVTSPAHIVSGHVGLAYEQGDSGLFGIVRVGGANASPNVRISRGASVDKLLSLSGESLVRGTIVAAGGSATDGEVIVYGGRVAMDTDSGIESLEVIGGECYPDRHGTITTALMQGGLASWLRTPHIRSVLEMILHDGADASWNPEHTTVTKLTWAGRLRMDVTRAT